MTPFFAMGSSFSLKKGGSAVIDSFTGMKLKFRVIPVGMISAATALSLLAGCSAPAASSASAGSADAGDDSGDPVKLTVFSQLANWSGAQTGWGATLLKDKFNIELNIIPDTDGAYQTRMESGNLGDLIVWGNNGSDYQSAVDKGMDFLPDGVESTVRSGIGKDLDRKSVV